MINEWIPVTTREITEEEREALGYGEDVEYMFTCNLPEDGEDILISQAEGKYVSLVTFMNDVDGVGDSMINDWSTEVDAWMPLPKGYVKQEG